VTRRVRSDSDRRCDTRSPAPSILLFIEVRIKASGASPDGEPGFFDDHCHERRED